MKLTMFDNTADSAETVARRIIQQYEERFGKRPYRITMSAFRHDGTSLVDGVQVVVGNVANDRVQVEIDIGEGGNE